MNHTKQLFFGLVLLMSVSTIYTYTQKNWRDLLNPEKNMDSVDRNELLDKYGEEVKNLFDLDSLSTQQKNIVFNMRKNCYGAVFALLNNKQYHSTWGAVIDMPKAAQQCFAEWAAAKAQITAQEHLQNEYGIFDEALINRAKDEVYNNALFHASTRNKGCLRYIVNGALEGSIKAEVDAEMQKRISAAKAAAAKKEKEIFEIYPQTQDGITQVRLNIEREQQIREDDCPVSLESFKDLGRRVNLRCRHSLSPCALYEIMYGKGNGKCPICGNDKKVPEISKADFPKDFLMTECRKQDVRP